MNSKYLFASAFLIIAVACEEEPSTQGPPDIAKVVSQEVIKSLGSQSNVNSFLEAFKDLEMSNKDVENGITIFAPVDNALEGNSYLPSQQARITASAIDAILTPEVLKNYIVTGILKASDFSDGEKLTALGGKELEVKVDGDDVFVNGVLLAGKEVATGEKFVVHTVAKLIPDEAIPVPLTTVEVIVWNAVKWAPDKPKGEVEAGVTVSFYHSQEDFVKGKPAFTQKTDVAGNAIFTGLEPEKPYYIVATKEGLSNIFHKSEQVENGVFTGMIPNGLFQTEEEIYTKAFQPDAKPGNFIWYDMDGNGRIDDADRAPIPHETVEPVSRETTQIEVIIGYDDNH